MSFTPAWKFYITQWNIIVEIKLLIVARQGLLFILISIKFHLCAEVKEAGIPAFTEINMPEIEVPYVT